MSCVDVRIASCSCLVVYRLWMGGVEVDQDVLGDGS